MKPIWMSAAGVCGLLTIFAGISLSQAPRKIQREDFGKTADGRQAYLYTLRNGSGMEVKITNYGGAIVSLKVPDRNGKSDDVVLGFPNVAGYTSKANAFFGALIGRYANRIAGGTFTLDGHQYHIPINDDPRPNALHGGPEGFDKKMWDVKDISTGNTAALELHYFSRDGEEGFPGNLNVTVRYTVGPKNELRIDYTATTDKDTVLNLTNHSYFNLAGAGSKTIVNNKVTLVADKFTPTNSNLIPTGELKNVAGTPFDFRKATVVGSRIDEKNQQLQFGKGYDHNFVLSRKGQGLELAAKVEDPSSGRVLEIFTTQPGIQFYTGNYLDGQAHGIGGTYGFRSALALETQHFPDSPNHSNFPSTVLHPGETFHSTTLWRFSTE